MTASAEREREERVDLVRPHRRGGDHEQRHVGEQQRELLQRTFELEALVQRPRVQDHAEERAQHEDPDRDVDRRDAQPRRRGAPAEDGHDPGRDHDREHEPVETQVDRHLHLEVDVVERHEPDDHEEHREHPRREPPRVRPRVRVVVARPRAGRFRRISEQAAQEQEDEPERDQVGEGANRRRHAVVDRAAARRPEAPQYDAVLDGDPLVVGHLAQPLLEVRVRGVGQALGLAERGRVRVDVEHRRRRARLDLEAVRPVLDEDLGRALLAGGLAERGGHERGCARVGAELVLRDLRHLRDVRDRRRARDNPAEQLGALDQRADRIRGLLDDRRRGRVDEDVHLRRGDRLDRAVRQPRRGERDDGAGGEDAEELQPRAHLPYQRPGDPGLLFYRAAAVTGLPVSSQTFPVKVLPLPDWTCAAGPNCPQRG